MIKVSKDTPLMEVTLRRYEKPGNLDDRELIRKFCLSLGLLQPGDSRDVIVDILHALLRHRIEKKELSSDEIRDIVLNFRKNGDKNSNGAASSNIRRQLKRLRDIHLVEKVRNKYRISEFSSLHDIYIEKISQYMIPPVMARVEDYFKAIDEKF